MRRPVDHAALSAAGYFAELGVAAGTDARFHLSTTNSDAAIRVVRLDRAAEPESTPRITARSDAPLAVQSQDMGSWLSIEPMPGFGTPRAGDPGTGISPHRPPEERTLIDGAGPRRALRPRWHTDPGGRRNRGWANSAQPAMAEWRAMQKPKRAFPVVTEGDATLAVLSATATSPAPVVIHLGADQAGMQPTLNLGIGRIDLTDAGPGSVVDAWRFPSVGRPQRLASIAGSGVLNIHNAPNLRPPLAALGRQRGRSALEAGAL